MHVCTRDHARVCAHIYTMLEAAFKISFRNTFKGEVHN